MDTPPLRSFRIVAPESSRPAVEALLTTQGYAFAPEPFSPSCYRLLAEPAPLGSSLAAFFGYIYIQDRSSMLPPLALNPTPGAMVLDMCASPGSKTSFLAQLCGNAGFVLANEPTPTRLGTLRANMRQLNLLQVGTTCQPGEQLPLQPATVENILLDPPCSGWGTAQKNPQVLKLWKGEKCQRLVALQQALLRRAALLLAPGGRLVYSTCTTNEAENEAQVAFAETELGLEREPITPFAGFAYEQRPGGEGTLRVDGAQSAAQGFYIASFRKPAARDAGLAPEACALAEEKGQTLQPGQLAGPCMDPDRLPPGRVALFGEQVRFIPRAAENLPRALAWQGALLGRMHGGAFTPDPRLRCCLPAAGENPEHSLVLEDIAPLQRLLSGQSLQTGHAGRELALWWRDLPLGMLALKSGRAVAVFK